MSTRLTTGGQRIDRSKPVTFTFNGTTLKGYEGDTLASALLANDRMMMGRSFKYHRPRGVVASGTEEPNALLGIGSGGRFEPNQRATMQEVFEGLEAQSQNHWPSLEFDIGEVNAKLSRFLPAGFYYKTFLWPRAFWKHVYEPFIRQSAGLGKAPKDRDADTYEHYYHFTDVLVIGGGPAAAVVFPRVVRKRVDADNRVIEARAKLKEGALQPLEFDRIRRAVHAEIQSAVATEFDNIHTVQRARDVGSLTDILSPKTLRHSLCERTHTAVDDFLAQKQNA